MIGMSGSTNFPVYTQLPTDVGVYGRSDGGHGVEGRSAGGVGVFGSSDQKAGVRGESTTSSGVEGTSEMGRGGVFQSTKAQRAQVGLTPLPIPSPQGVLAGELGDLVTTLGGGATEAACSIWLCVRPGAAGVAIWRQLAFV